MASPPQPSFSVPYLHPPNLCFHVMDFALLYQSICCFPHLFCQLELFLPQQDLMPSEKKGEGRRKLEPQLPAQCSTLTASYWQSFPKWIWAKSSSHMLELLKPTSSQLLLAPDTAETLSVSVFQTFIPFSRKARSTFAGARFGDWRTGTWTQSHRTLALWYLLCFYQAVQEPFLLLSQLTVPLMHLQSFFFCCLDLGRTKCSAVRLRSFSAFLPLMCMGG